MEVGMVGSTQQMEFVSKSITATCGEDPNTATAVIRCQNMEERSATQVLDSWKNHIPSVPQVG
jgi:hypothetical protein